MSSEKDNKKLKEVLGKFCLVQYFEAFLNEGISYSDLEHLEEGDILNVIPKKFHQRKFFKCLEDLKSTGKKFDDIPPTEDSPEHSNGKKEGSEVVQLFVKWGKSVVNLYDIPLHISNKELISELLHEFLQCEIKLQGEERSLVKNLKSFNLKKWVEKNDVSVEDTIRAVLKVKGDNVGGGDSSTAGEGVEGLKQEIDYLRENEKSLLKKEAILEEGLKKEKVEGKRMEKLIEAKNREVAVLEKELQVLKTKKKKWTKEKVLLGKKLKNERMKRQEQEEEVKQKLRELNEKITKLEIENKQFTSAAIKKKVSPQLQFTISSTSVKGDSCLFGRIRGGILVPDHSFIPQMFDETEATFSLGNKRAMAPFNKFAGFVTNAVFRAGKKYYYEVIVSKANARGSNLAIGVVNFTKTGTFNPKQFLGKCPGGWCFNFSPESDYPMMLYAGGVCTSQSTYGVRLKTKHKVGVLVDFSAGEQGEMSFFIDGKNCGSAFRNVLAPVSPAFSLYYKGDVIDIHYNGPKRKEKFVE